MSKNDQPRERTNTSLRIRNAMSWTIPEMSKRTRVSGRQVRRRENWLEEEERWEQKVDGEALTLHELILACTEANLGWLVDRVTSGGYSSASLRQELSERGGDVVLKLEDIDGVIEEAISVLRSLPGDEANERRSAISRLVEARAHVREEIRVLRSLGEGEAE